MGAIITRREYTNQFRPETTSWLLGNVGDRINLELDVEIEIRSTSSFSNPFESNGTDQLTRSTGSFLDDGFYIGANVAWTYDTGAGITGGNGTITTLTPTVMRITLLAGFFPPAGFFPFNDGTITNSTLDVYCDTNVEGLVLNYNLIANSDVSSASLNSLVDGTTPRFEVNGLDPTDTVTVLNLNPVGFQSGHSIFGATVVGAGKVSGVQSFTISIDFEIIPLFDTIDDFRNNVAPEFLFDIDSLTDVFELAFFPQYNNPNVIVATDSKETAFDGNVGWFDENYNGGTNNYSVVGVVYTDADTGANTGAISKDKNTNFQIVLNQTGASATSEYALGFFYVPEDKTLIQDNNQTNYQNILLNDLGQTINQGTSQFTFNGYQNASGAGMDIRFDSITNNGSTVYINGQFQPNSDFATYFDSISTTDWNYVLFVSVADETLATNVADRVSLRCDFNQFIEEPTTFVLGDVDIEFFNHAQDTTNAGSSVYSGSVEDEVLTNSLMFLDTAKGEKVDSITFLIEGFNTATGQSFECERYDIETTSFQPDNDGVQQIAIDTTRGFQMAAGVNKNFVKVFRDQTLDVGTKKAYLLQYAVRPRWEYWIENSDVPNQLIDASQRFQGKNQDWARLDSVFNDWRLRFSVQTQLNSDGSLLTTRNSSNIYVRGYEESTVWDGSINHYNESKTVNLYTGLDANGVRTNAILPDENTLIEADFDLEDVMGDVGNISDYYGVIRIEVFEQGGIKGIEMLSSVLDNKDDILKPVVGETLCKIEKISNTKIRLSALIDFNFLDTTVGYRTSARIGYKNLMTVGPYGNQYGPQYA